MVAFSYSKRTKLELSLIGYLLTEGGLYLNIKLLIFLKYNNVISLKQVVATRLFTETAATLINSLCFDPLNFQKYSFNLSKSGT